MRLASDSEKHDTAGDLHATEAQTPKVGTATAEDGGGELKGYL